MLEDVFRQRPKALILCNPSNPCGKVFTREELTLIADLAEKYDTFVITDEVYEHIVYEPNEHIYFASLPGMWERTISCSSLSKTYSITGWRLGYIIAPANIVDTAKKVHDFLTVGAAAPLQEAAVTGLKFGDEYYRDLRRKYTEKRNLFLKGLDDIGIAHTTPQGRIMFSWTFPNLAMIRIWNSVRRWRVMSEWAQYPVPASFANRSTI